MTDVLGYHHLSLSVTDLGKSTEWYQQVLSLDVAAEIEGDGFRRTRLRAAGSGVTLTLTAHDQQSGEPFSERRAGMDHVAFQVGGVESVEALKTRFEELGVTHSGVKSRTTGTAMITLRDRTTSRSRSSVDRPTRRSPPAADRPAQAVRRGCRRQPRWHDLWPDRRRARRPGVIVSLASTMRAGISDVSLRTL